MKTYGLKCSSGNRRRSVSISLALHQTTASHKLPDLFFKFKNALSSLTWLNVEKERSIPVKSMSEKSHRAKYILSIRIPGFDICVDANSLLIDWRSLFRS